MISVQVESFRRAIPELEKIFKTHWEELALYRDRMPLSPQWDEYCRREDADTLFLTTVRKDGEIVAYYITQVTRGFHYSETLTAHMDIVYVVPEYRGRGISLPLFRAVERELRRRGVKLWYSGYKSHNPLGLDKLLDKMNFTPADVYCAKWLD